MRRNAIVLSAVLGATALLASACSPSGSDEPKDRVSIGKLLGQPDYENYDWQDQERRVQELVAQCMREQGWEYIPVEYPDNWYDYDESDYETQLKERGWGIVWYTLHQNDQDPDYEDPMAGWVDPNQEYVESLSEKELEAYYASLWGTQEEQEASQREVVDPDTGEVYWESIGFGAGCQGKAYEEVNGNDPSNQQGYWEAISAFYEELEERVQADPRIVELDKEWASCMKKQNLDYASLTEFYDKGYASIQTKHDEIVGDQMYRDPFEGWTEDEINDWFENTSPEQQDAFWTDLYTIKLSDDQRAQLEDLLQEEIALATAELGCSKPYNEKAADIRADIEERYALEHEAELREIAAQFATKK